ncbi:MAG TPA: TonB family protein [Bryobacteraceae bacterium]|jgi:TonB family protein|nr:TonB family protein [Bryobacteraceae bacterium]
MFRFTRCVALVLLAVSPAGAQAPAGPDDPVEIGPGVKPPILRHKTDPEYSPEARADHIQGNVLLQLVVNSKGRPTDIAVISPLGFGLDELAQAAVEKWEFSPGMKDGKPVSILATIEVNFRFPGIQFDEKTERRRTVYNEDLQRLKRQNNSQAETESAVKSMRDLARQHFAPAMYLLGVWELAGEYVTTNLPDGFLQIQNAAAKNYAPALFQIAIRQIEGRDLPKDPATGLDKMRQASVLGSPQAQFYLGDVYETGNGVPPDPARARRHFQLCAAAGVASCQYRVGRLLLHVPNRRERDYVQGVAWMQLAAAQGFAEAKDTAAAETAGLTPEQTAQIASLKTQLIRK